MSPWWYIKFVAEAPRAARARCSDFDKYFVFSEQFWCHRDIGSGVVSLSAQHILLYLWPHNDTNCCGLCASGAYEWGLRLVSSHKLLLAIGSTHRTAYTIIIMLSVVLRTRVLYGRTLKCYMKQYDDITQDFFKILAKGGQNDIWWYIGEGGKVVLSSWR